ncbi:MAG TPA: ankyrin repeat domain-containing protein [Allosphingosinicella sp.]|nr:ankyrin repeat domain-containing protein [Allosphingosinicella sp.]
MSGEAEVAAFLRAVGDGDLWAVRDLLAADPDLVHAVGPHPYWGGRPQALHVAIETKRAEMVDLLLAAGADPNGRNGDYDLWSPLMLAIHRGRPDLQEALISRGARIGLVEALMLKDDAAVDTLLADGLPPLAPNGGSLLAFAGTPLAIDRLIAAGAPVHQKDRWGTIPVEAMSRLGPGGGALVRHMMAHGVRVDAEAFARLGDRDMLAALVESDPEVARREAVLIAAVEAGHPDLVRWLLSMGADANARAAGRSGQSVLHAAAWNGDLDMAQLLVEYGADLHARDADHRETPRGWAETAATVTNNPKCMDVAAWLAARGG